MKKLIVLFTLMAVIMFSLGIAATIQNIHSHNSSQTVDTLSIAMMYMTGVGFGIIDFFLIKEKTKKDIADSFRKPML
jgi:hypothetical protein